MFHLLNITERGTKLSVKDGLVSVQCIDDTKSFQRTVDQVDALILEQPAVSVSGCLMEMLAKKRIPMICCDSNHLPVAVLNPVGQHGAEYHSMLKLQLQMKQPWKKQIWKRLIQRKISIQSENLKRKCSSSSIAGVAELVKSGDTDNTEARAAAVYWKELALFPVRNRFAPDANRLFNYAYSVLYAAFARLICASALNPDIAVFHHGRDNPFSLASDLMEPYRPLFDRCIFDFMDQVPGKIVLDPDARKKMLHIIYTAEIIYDGKKKNLLNSISPTVLSFKRALKRSDPDLLILPEVQ